MLNYNYFYVKIGKILIIFVRGDFMLSKFFRSTGIISLIATIGTVTNHAVCSARKVACNDGRNSTREGNFSLNKSIKSNNPEKNRFIVVRENKQKNVSVSEKVGEVVGAVGGLLVGAPLAAPVTFAGLLASAAVGSALAATASMLTGVLICLASAAAGEVVGGFAGKAVNSLLFS